MRILVTGGLGFIGSAVVRQLIEGTDYEIGIIDKGGYASDVRNIPYPHPRIQLWACDLSDSSMTSNILDYFKPDYIMHLAAESHVDNSITDPSPFIQSNIIGTFNLLEAVRKYVPTLRMFHHISTDEVYGDIADMTDPQPFHEGMCYRPSSPYSASKAASDHLVKAWGRTYNINTVITNCSNNYGPYHHPEKLIPKTIINALRGDSIPVYRDGSQIRDWLYVEDHAKALITIVVNAVPGETYNIGSDNPKTNLEVIKTILSYLDERLPKETSYLNLIEFVKDRPGHDLHYTIDATHLKEDFDWESSVTFSEGIIETIEWYLNNEHWWVNK